MMRTSIPVGKNEGFVVVVSGSSSEVYDRCENHGLPTSIGKNQPRMLCPITWHQFSYGPQSQGLANASDVMIAKVRPGFVRGVFRSVLLSSKCVMN